MKPNTEVVQEIPKGKSTHYRGSPNQGRYALIPLFSSSYNACPGWNGLIYTLKGDGTFGEKHYPAHHTLVLSNSGDEDGIHVTAGSQGLHFALICGKPLNEPVVQHGKNLFQLHEHTMYIFL